ncbi:hypothetical protein MRB53_034799 [Persea americana]|uniref:Uncharacterized protein n=1 Tax=Persea americana TaxID=3435 RepID=A0ACC2K332_PERAE|nr:hypothetical protein MRB53_034799 [Persea americana]
MAQHCQLRLATIGKLQWGQKRDRQPSPTTASHRSGNDTLLLKESSSYLHFHFYLQLGHYQECQLHQRRGWILGESRKRRNPLTLNSLNDSGIT